MRTSKQELYRFDPACTVVCSFAFLSYLLHALKFTPIVKSFTDWHGTCIHKVCYAQLRNQRPVDGVMNADPASMKTSFGQPPEETTPTILLVEDETDVREVTRAVLEHAGYRVLASTGPEEALRLGSEHRGCIALLLSDVVMPGMSGPELALRLQSLQPSLVAVFMSGYADHDVLRKAMHGGMTNYLQKPFTINVLLSRVAAALRTSKASEAALLSSLSGR